MGSNYVQRWHLELRATHLKQVLEKEAPTGIFWCNWVYTSLWGTLVSVSKLTLTFQPLRPPFLFSPSTSQWQNLGGDGKCVTIKLISLHLVIGCEGCFSGLLLAQQGWRYISSAWGQNVKQWCPRGCPGLTGQHKQKNKRQASDFHSSIPSSLQVQWFQPLTVDI